jgi:hypothetical protein
MNTDSTQTSGSIWAFLTRHSHRLPGGTRVQYKGKGLRVSDYRCSLCHRSKLELFPCASTSSHIDTLFSISLVYRYGSGVGGTQEVNEAFRLLRVQIGVEMTLGLCAIGCHFSSQESFVS